MTNVSWKKAALLVAGGVALNWSLHNISSILGGLQFVWGLLFPFALGLIIAFLLNLPMQTLEKKLFGKKQTKLARPISLFLALVIVLGIVSLVVFLVIPEMAQTFVLLGRAMPAYYDSLQEYTKLYTQYIPALQALAKDLNIDWQSLAAQAAGILQSGVSGAFNSAAQVATSVVSGTFAFFLGFIFAIYMLFDKEHLMGQSKGVLQAYLPPARYAQLEKILKLVYRTFAQFVSGQCREALAVGALFTVALWIGRFDYALMIGVLIGFMSLIPVVGSFIGCVVGLFLILVAQGPWRALAFLIVFLVLQQIDGNFMYPYIVGNQVGLPPLWVMLAVLTGGTLAGIVGMLTFIPIFSILYTLLSEATKNRLKDKNIPSPIPVAAEKPPQKPKKSKQKK